MNHEKSVEIISANPRKNVVNNEKEIIEKVTKMISDELTFDCDFEFNVEDEIEMYMEYPIMALGEVKIDDKVYLMEINRYTNNENLIINTKIFCEEDYIYNGIDDVLYDLKVEIKQILKKMFKDVYWQFDIHNNYICQELYSKIYSIENEFRQIIAEFMLKKFGYEWYTRVVNSSLKSKIETYSKWYRDNYTEFKDVYIDLFNLQVKDLLELLKSSYDKNVVARKIDEQLKKEKIGTLSAVEDERKVAIKLKKIKDDIIQENNEWDCCIEKILGQDFNNQWEMFEMMRNMVAHNKPICRKLYSDFVKQEKILMERFKQLTTYIQENFDAACKEARDLSTSKLYVDYMTYEQMYREEAGLEQLPEDEAEVWNDINEDNDIYDFMNMIDEYSNDFTKCVEELEYYTDEIEYSNMDTTIKEYIAEHLFKIDSVQLTEIVYEQKMSELIGVLTNKIDDIRYESVMANGIIAELEGLWQGKIKVQVDGDICIEAGNTDNISVYLLLNEDVIASGNIERCYGDYSLIDGGVAYPEVEDCLGVDIEEVKNTMQDYFEETLGTLGQVIELFENMVC